MAWSMAATTTDALWGSTPISTFMGAYLRFGRTSATIGGRAKGIASSRRAHTSFEPLRTPGTGGTQAENRPTHIRATGSWRAIPV